MNKPKQSELKVQELPATQEQVNQLELADIDVREAMATIRVMEEYKENQEAWNTPREIQLGAGSDERMELHQRNIRQNGLSLFVDVDSCLSEHEHYNKLIEFAMRSDKLTDEKYTETKQNVEEAQKAGMRGGGLTASLAARGAAYPVKKKHVAAYIQQHCTSGFEAPIVNLISKAIAVAKERGEDPSNAVYLISGGHSELIEPMLEHLNEVHGWGLNTRKNIVANTFNYNEGGEITGTKESLTTMNTKNTAMQMVKKRDNHNANRVYMNIGDGSSDMVQPEVSNLTLGYQKNADNETTQKHADKVLMTNKDVDAFTEEFFQ